MIFSASSRGIFLYFISWSFFVEGATDYSCFRGLLKQLVGPLSTQLADRRSTIVKQVS